VEECLPTTSYNTPLVKIGALVVRDGRPKFTRPWVTLFEAPADLTRVAKAALVDLAWSSARTRDGMLVGNFSDLQLPTSTAHRAVAELSRAGIVHRRRGRLYINPAVVYAGPIHRHEAALDAWNKLLEEEGGQ